MWWTYTDPSRAAAAGPSQGAWYFFWRISGYHNPHLLFVLPCVFSARSSVTLNTERASIVLDFRTAQVGEPGSCSPLSSQAQEGSGPAVWRSGEQAGWAPGTVIKTQHDRKRWVGNPGLGSGLGMEWGKRRRWDGWEICKSDISHHHTRSTTASGRKPASPRSNENMVTEHWSLELMSKFQQNSDTMGFGLRKQKPFKCQWSSPCSTS